MSVAVPIISIVLAAVLVLTGYATLTGREAVRRGVIEVGFPPSYVWLLGVAQLAGAVGLIVGLWWPALAIAAAGCLVVYFIGAVGAHVRVGHPRYAGPSAAILLGSVAALVLVVLNNA
jgi:uncharacterized membrane protein YphA (DoxX/SURF4 family)